MVSAKGGQLLGVIANRRQNLPAVPILGKEGADHRMGAHPWVHDGGRARPDRGHVAGAICHASVSDGGPVLQSSGPD
jgi:hypothetical protein